jgi:hypothetical protein
MYFYLFFIYLTTLSIAKIKNRRIVGWSGNNELQWIWKKSLMPDVSYCPGLCLGELKTTRYPSQRCRFPGRDLNPESLEYEIAVLMTQVPCLVRFMEMWQRACYSFMTWASSRKKFCVKYSSSQNSLLIQYPLLDHISSTYYHNLCSRTLPSTSRSFRFSFLSIFCNKIFCKFPFTVMHATCTTQ